MDDAYKDATSGPSFSPDEQRLGWGDCPSSLQRGNFNKDGALRGSKVPDFIGRTPWTYTARLRQLIAQQVAIQELIIQLVS